jgi:uncharacterized membrane protein YpjA
MQPVPEKIRELALSEDGLLAFAAVNFLGTLFGFYYYMPQFSETNSFLWLFVADSPLATLSIAISFLMYRFDMQNRFIDILAYIGNIKYGLWTVFVLIHYFQTFWIGNSTPMYLFLLFSHFGMFLQAFLVQEYSEFDLKVLVGGGSWFLLNDLFDYSLDIHTYVYTSHPHPVSAIAIVAVLLTVIGVILGYLNRSS